MNIRSFYETQTEVRQTGNEIDGRVRKAGKLFLRYLFRADRVLDIGCGVGAVGLYLKGLLGAREAWGLELSRGRAEAAQARGVNAVVCDLNQEGLPFKKDSFDAIFCGEVIEHLVDPDRLLDEVARVLTSGGVCVLTTPNLACWFNRIALLLGWQPFATSVSFRHEVGRPKVFVGDYGCRDHLRVFTLRALRELLEVRGFRILEVDGCSLSDLIGSAVEWKKKRLRDIVYRLVSPFDYLMAKRPLFAAGLAVAFDKGRLGTSASGKYDTGSVEKGSLQSHFHPEVKASVGDRIIVFEQEEFNFFTVAHLLSRESDTSLPLLPVAEGNGPKSRQDLAADPDAYVVCGALKLVINDPENHFGRFVGNYAVWRVLGFP